MRLELIRRPQRSAALALLSPVLAFALTILAGALVFAMVGVDPLRGLHAFFIEPLTEWWSVEDLIIKATPIILTAIGLSLCYQANVWNIGAEGQIIAGAIAGSAIPILFPTFTAWPVLPLMLTAGIVGGMAYAAVPALLKVRFGASEILTSLMLVYVAQLLVDWLARGPWRNPAGFNFPDSRRFTGAQRLPELFGTDIHIGVIFVLVAAAAVWFLSRRTLTGFRIRVLGQAPRAGAFAGFSQNRTVVLTFLISGGLAGLAGICEVAGPTGQLRTTVTPGYGFTAIIVAFLGRLHPAGIVVAGLVLGLTYIGGEGAQMALGLPEQITRVFQGMLLFFVLACDTLIAYRVRLVFDRRSAAPPTRPAPAPSPEAAHGAS